MTGDRSGDGQFETISTNFLAWFTSQPSTTTHPSICIRDLRSQHAGRGVVATADIPAGTVLFTIPRNTILTPSTSALQAGLPSLFSRQHDEAAEEIEESALPAPWLELILVLMCEHLQGSASRWAPYLSYLPNTASDFNTLIFWSDHELSELQASHVRHKLGKDSADRDFRRFILPFVKANESLFYTGAGNARSKLSDEQVLELAHVMGSVVMAYAFDLENENDDSDADENGEDGWTEDKQRPQQLGMVPFADLLNADAEFNAHLAHLDDRLEMTSIREIKAGEEVLNYYGPNANSEVLRRYGYTSQKHSRYDVVELNWRGIKRAVTDGGKLEHVLEQIESENGWTDDEAFVLERDSDGPGDDGLFEGDAKFTQLPEDLVDALSDIVKHAIPEAGTDPKLLKGRVLELAKSVIEARTAEYATTIEEDESLLARGAQGRSKMAIDVRLGEKRLLREALDWTEERLAKYSEQAGKHRMNNGSDGSTQSARKRQKR